MLTLVHLEPEVVIVPAGAVARASLLANSLKAGSALYQTGVKLV